MRIIDFRLSKHTQFFQKGSKLFFIEKLLALLFLSLCIVLLKHAMEIDARARGKKWWTIVVEWQSAIGNMRILKSCEGTSKINEPKVNVSVVVFSSSVMERFFLVFFKSLRIYCWFGDIIDWHPSPSQSPSEMWLLKCSSENWNATRKNWIWYSNEVQLPDCIMWSLGILRSFRTETFRVNVFERDAVSKPKYTLSKTVRNNVSRDTKRTLTERLCKHPNPNGWKAKKSTHLVYKFV